MPDLQRSVMTKMYGTDIWHDFQARPQDELQGWNGDHPSLSRLVSVSGAKIVVDVGVWKGGSTITMANAMRQANIDGVVIAVDTFLGSPEHWSRVDLFERSNGLPDLYWNFLSNVFKAGLTDWVVPMPQTSSTAAAILRRMEIQPAVIHVDAAHEYREVMNDLVDYWSILQDGGYLIGDDYAETWPGIVKAAGEFSATVGKPLSVEPPKFIIKK